MNKGVFDDYTSLLKEMYRDIVGKSIGEDAAHQICRALTSYRCLSSEFSKYPHKVIRDLIATNFQTEFAYTPLDVVELRGVLSAKQLFPSRPIVFFTLPFARKHLLDHPILLGVELNVHDLPYGVIVREETVDISQALKKIVLRTELVDERIVMSVRDVVSQEFPEVNIEFLTDVPGIRQPLID